MEEKRKDEMIMPETSERIIDKEVISLSRVSDDM